MKKIVSISFSQGFNNFDKIIEFLGHKIRISHYSIPFDMENYESLISHFDSKCDVIAISGLPHSVSFSNRIYSHETKHKLLTSVTSTLICDGQKLRDVYIPWALRNYCQKNRLFIKNQKIGVLMGILHKNIIPTLEEFKAKVFMADPYLLFNIPLAFKDGKNLDLFFKTTKKILKRYPIEKDIKRHFSAPITKFGNISEFKKCNIILTYKTILDFINLDFLKDKSLVVDYLDTKTEETLKSIGVKNVITCMPKIVDLDNINYSIIEAIFQALHDEDIPLNSDDILEWIDRLEISPDIKMLNEKTMQKKTKFAFVIHPLSDYDLFRHPAVKFLKPYAKNVLPILKTATKNVMQFSKVGTIEGIESEQNGELVEGDIYTIFETPREIMSSKPEKIYKKLLKISEHARKNGAEIMGLGAYTKIVGDQGVTVARKSLVPITTGNSLSAAATLWAAGHAIKRMRLVERDNQNIYQGTVMVVGASGSIGSVASKILVQHWKKIILVAPRGHKLLELKSSLQEIAPHIDVKLTTRTDKYINEADLIITSTSGQGEAILDILKVKSGAVICDVSRPFDIPEEDALKRPDVLVIASGEVDLPGNVKSNIDMGLHGTTVYACLAETALLAMEGRFESFTLSRNISYSKVREIDQMARKHGVKLAQIMGHSGIISDEEIELCRNHALKKIISSVKTEGELSKSNKDKEIKLVSEDEMPPKSFRS